MKIMHEDQMWDSTSSVHCGDRGRYVVLFNPLNHPATEVGEAALGNSFTCYGKDFLNTSLVAVKMSITPPFVFAFGREKRID